MGTLYAGSKIDKQMTQFMEIFSTDFEKELIAAEHLLNIQVKDYTAARADSRNSVESWKHHLTRIVRLAAMGDALTNEEVAASLNITFDTAQNRLDVLVASGHLKRTIERYKPYYRFTGKPFDVESYAAGRLFTERIERVRKKTKKVLEQAAKGEITTLVERYRAWMRTVFGENSELMEFFFTPKNKSAKNIDERLKKKVLIFAKRRKEKGIAKRDVKKEYRLSDAIIYNILGVLVQEGLLERRGKASETRYFLK